MTRFLPLRTVPRAFVAAQTAMAKCQHDLGMVMLDEPSDARTQQLASSVTALNRITADLRRELLGRPAGPAPVSHQMTRAAHAALREALGLPDTEFLEVGEDLSEDDQALLRRLDEFDIRPVVNAIIAVAIKEGTLP